MNRNAQWTALAACAVALAGSMLTLGGCAGEDDQQVAVVPPPPPPPPPPPAPAVTPIADLMAELNIDKRVVLPEERAPATDPERKAVLVFFDAFARGNAQALRSMLPLSDQLELKALVDSGDWEKTASQIQRIEVQTGSNNLNQKCALAVFEVGHGATTNFQPQLWYYTLEEDAAMFEAAPTPPGILDKLSGDWIAAWHQILAAELELAQKPDDDVTVPQRNLDSGQGPSTSSGGGGGAPGGPAPPGGRRIREPTGPKTPAP